VPLQLPEMIGGRNVFLGIGMVLLLALGLAVFKVDQPAQPSGSVGDALLTTIADLATASEAKVEKSKCRMITKQYVVVICEVERMNRVAAARKLITDGWVSQGKQDGAMLEFSRGRDHLAIEDVPGGIQAVSLIRRF
jgi:hypothetical protein